MDLLSIDCEYSNFNVSKGDLLQLGAVAIVNGEKHTFCEYARPMNLNHWKTEAEKVHGISIKRAQTFQHISEMADKFSKFLDQFDTVFTPIGWNCRNDINYIRKLINKYMIVGDYYYKVRHNWIDVMDIVKKRSGQLRPKDYKLSTVAKLLKIDINAHDALSDAMATYLIYDLVKNIKKDDENYIQLSNNKNLTEVEKQRKYIDQKYVTINNGEVYLTKECTSDPEALRVVMSKLWDLFGSTL